MLALAGGYVVQQDGSDDPTASDPRIEVPNVYNLPVARGLSILEDRGFTEVTSEAVCSNSVAVNSIREVVLDNNPTDVSDETSIVNQNGAVIASLDADTPLLVKVSNGNPC